MVYKSTVNGYRIYELDKKECEINYKLYPTYVCYREDDREHIGDCNYTENECSSYLDMGIWCINH